MHDQSKAKLRRLLIWFTINLIIFISCYLNYHLQLKHRYLYKTLSAGLCLSRAAAMVINFNLILVWIPMCKYTLTRLAVIACGYNQRQKIKLSYLISNSKRGESSSRQYSKTDPGHQNPEKGGAIFQIVPIGTAHNLIGDNHQRAFNSRQPPPDVSRLRNLGEKLKLLVIQAQFRISHAICSLTIKAINSFLIAVDHSTSLHTISATTITLASVIHTAAHLMNVINFSNNFDPLLSNLNMAEYKGQNPLQLLVSVPGITGCFMILILILMSLSSISAIRNSSFDLFQIFHRLSVLFVIFLILHPSSHVLKEQSNVDRHNPDICYDEMVKLRNVILASARATTNQTHDLSLVELVDADQLVLLGTTRATSSNEEKSTTSQPLLKATTGTNVSPISNAETRATSDLTMNKRSISISRRRESNEERVPAMSTPVGTNAGYDDSDHHHHTIIIKLRQNNSIIANSHHSPSQADTSYHQSPVCQDIVPRFVAQSSICWYVLGAGLSCYLMDLILRRLRRNRNPIELLAARSDAEGNLIELTLSNNHERFAHWLPGQFVYLNCPQIATYEWHPFTISSMDNRTRQFTLHIKTGGDWTRKLRHELVKLRQEQEQQQQQLLQLQEGCYQVQPCNSGRNSMSLFSTRRNTYSIKHCCNFHFKGTAGYSDGGSGGKLAGQAVHQYPAIQYHSNLIHSGGSDYGDGGGKDLQGIRLTNFDCHDDHQAGLWWPSTTGQQQLRATQCSGRPPVHVAVRVDNDKSQRRAEGELELNDAVKIELDQRPTTANERRSDSICGWLWRGLKPSSSSSIVGTHQNQKLVNNSQATNACKQMTKSDNAPKSSDKLHLFIDGPFHSPFERLLEQQVSICIANGVGWTAFSSVFQQIANKNNNRKLQPDDEDWWSQWRNYLATSKPKRTQHMKSTANSGYNDGDDGDNCTNAVTIPTLSSSAVHGSAEQKLSNDTKLHLMIIVTTIEQLKPFYSIVKKYFERLQLDCSFEGRGGETIYNPVREITAYITRSSRNDADVIEFCRQEGLLDAPNNNLDEVGGSSLLVNKSFAIKFGKPNFDTYLSEFSTLYEDKRKISIYCCGSYEVKRAVEKICQSLNKYPRSISGSKPVYCYHEENF